MSQPTRKQLLSLLWSWRALGGKSPSLELLNATNEALEANTRTPELPGQTSVYDFQDDYDPRDDSSPGVW